MTDVTSPNTSVEALDIKSFLSNLSGEDLRYLFGPVMHQAGGWADTVPAWLRDRVGAARLHVLQREATNSSQSVGLASDEEALIIIYESVLCGPPTEVIGSLYPKLTYRVMKAAGRLADHHEPFPIEGGTDPFTIDEQRALREIQYKIRARVMKACSLSQAKEAMRLIEN